MEERGSPNDGRSIIEYKLSVEPCLANFAEESAKIAPLNRAGMLS